jgi:hypothetical protein
VTHSHCESCGWAGEIVVGDRLLCLGCASAETPADPVPAPVTGGFIRYTDGRLEPCHHPNGTHRDGSCVDCGYC